MDLDSILKTNKQKGVGTHKTTINTDKNIHEYEEKESLKAEETKAKKNEQNEESLTDRELILSENPYKNFDEKLSDKTEEEFVETYIKEEEGPTSDFDFEQTFRGSSKNQKDSGKGGIYVQNRGKGFLNTDTIWVGVAVGCLLGVILFFFQGLQPMVLNNYTLNAKKQIVELNDGYRDKGTTLVDAQNQIYSNSLYNTLIICSSDQAYQGYEADLEMASMVESSFKPSLDYKTLPNYRFFYDRKTKDIYQEFYNEYVSAIQIGDNVSDNLGQAVTYLKYRNNWINLCDKINASSSSDIQQVKTACTTLRAETETFKATGNKYWTAIEEPANQGLTYCKTVEENPGNSFSGFDRWKLNWNNSYDDIVRADLDFQEDNREVNEAANNLNDLAVKSQQEIDDHYNQKIKFENLWYFLDFKI